MEALLAAPWPSGRARGGTSLSLRDARGGALSTRAGVRFVHVAGVVRSTKPAISSPAFGSHRSRIAATSQSHSVDADAFEAEAEVEAGAKASSDQTEAASEQTNGLPGSRSEGVQPREVSEQDGVATETEDTRIQAQTAPGFEEAVRVKFILRQSCEFGEQFVLAGEDPALGSWNPGSAAPLEWSEGDVWTVETELPAGKEIKFKFLLRELSGGVRWQPGPDRLLRTWQTAKTIVVALDWENDEARFISEEEGKADEEEQGVTMTSDGEDAPEQETTSALQVIAPYEVDGAAEGYSETGEEPEDDDDGTAEGKLDGGGGEAEAPVARKLDELDDLEDLAEGEEEPARWGGVLEKDIQWWRETLQKMLGHLGFFQQRESA